MNKSGFAVCDHLFDFGCNGEVVNLIKVAERYGILMEMARARIETICRRCSYSPRPSKDCPDKK